jgi:dipeptidyl aminopeptidase/acylaminoacyl peptidase
MSRLSTMIPAFALALLSCTALQEAPTSSDATPSGDPISLEQIMADPAWIGPSPEDAFWEDDSQSIWYRRSRPGRDGGEWVHLDLSGKELGVVDEESAGSLRREGVVSRNSERLLYEREGDLWMRSRSEGVDSPLTHTSARESRPFFLADEARIAYERDGVLFVRDLTTGEERQPADLELDDAPKEDGAAKDEASPGFLEEQQRRLFETLAEAREREERSKERAKTAKNEREARATPVFHLGSDGQNPRANLSPDERFLLVRLTHKGGQSGRADVMPRYVTTSGYVETENVRSKVGTEKEAAAALFLIDLVANEQIPLDLGTLPGIHDDPLASLRASAKAWREALVAGTAPPAAPEPVATATEESAPPPPARPVSIVRVSWSDDGRRALVQARSHDNKDDWILVVDPEKRTLTTIDHLHDDAWVNGQLRGCGWLAGGLRMWFLSEASGWAHLYLHDEATGATKELTTGEWEASDVTPSRDGSWLYFVANVEHPGEHELWRVHCEDARLERITALGGRNEAWLSPDETKVLVLHSTLLELPDLYLQDDLPRAPATRLTATASELFRAQPWIVPQVLPVPSRNGRPIWSRLYLPPNQSAGSPAVLFVHGAGYLQEAHLGWSSYFREFMFHSLLAYRGYVVLDMDYRASAGYGRDWRTAIYRRMGEPELEDLEDGVNWLVTEHQVDAARVGVYGGSYGGFLTLMALFEHPTLFACGAALRPVTDWAHYSEGYTSNILNTPDVDPEAYWKSSPIEHAAGLARPLLMCHGMLDDNVFFQDTVRLTQRLIELGKQDWEVAPYPMEAHGFREPSSWLDEYRRILALFEKTLRPPEERP